MPAFADEPVGETYYSMVPNSGGVVVILKVAVTVMLAERFTVHVPVPLHPPPLQPLKVEPVAGVAVRVIEVPEFDV